MKRIGGRDLAEDHETMDGNDDRREQERPGRVLDEAQCFAGKLLLPQALWNKLCGDGDRENNKKGAQNDRAHGGQQASPVAVCRNKGRHDLQAALSHAGEPRNVADDVCRYRGREGSTPRVFTFGGRPSCCCGRSRAPLTTRA
jgi:hypothetical protein